MCPVRVVRYLAAQKGFTEVVRVLLVGGTAANFVMPSTPMVFIVDFVREIYINAYGALATLIRSFRSSILPTVP